MYMSRHMLRDYFVDEDGDDACVEMNLTSKNYWVVSSREVTRMPSKKARLKSLLDMFFTPNLAYVKTRKD